MNEILDQETEKRIQSWLQGAYDEQTKSTIQELYKDHKKDLIDAFYTSLSFGTGGLRGLMGVGTNRMNIYTVAQATQGLANYIKSLNGSSKTSVFISFDSRHLSREFAKEAAKVLAGNDIKAYLTKDLRPTPLVSFGCRFYQCQAAIMITASHNPKEYNGYKVYWNDGAQVLPPHDEKIIEAFQQIDHLNQIKKVKTLNDPNIQYVGKELDEAYQKAIETLQIQKELIKTQGSDLKIIYTSLHGTGITLIPEAFKNAGFTNVVYVDSQCIPDGDFPTVKSPNPEEKNALQLGIQTLESENGDILIANDPDADRVGVAVKQGNHVICLNGNQIASILIYYLLSTLSDRNELAENAIVVKTIVTTELFRKIAESFKKECFDVLTGFKYIAEKIREWETLEKGPKYIFGAEESYGYLQGTIVRDKDAISTSLLIAEVALSAKSEGKTLIDLLNEIYAKYGCFVESVLSVQFDESKAGKEEMKRGMDSLKRNPPREIDGSPVIFFENYAESIKHNLLTGTQESITLPKSDVLIFRLKDGRKLIIRPSGTEPKIKIYAGAVIETFDNLEEAFKEGQKRVNSLCSYAKYLLSHH